MYRQLRKRLFLVSSGDEKIKKVLNEIYEETSIRLVNHKFKEVKIVRKKIALIFFSILILLSVGSSVYATDVHSLGYSSVDESEIRWEASNWYSSNRTTAISNWNNLNPIDILPDTIWSVNDLTFTDVNRSDVVWAGQYYYYPYLADAIQVNNYYLDGYSSDQRTMVFAHELGHALGIGDHTSSSDILMYYSVTSITTPQSHDIADYNALWN